MIDIETRRIIDIIDTRDLEGVQKWFKTFPALRFVSRDGSITYKSAITQANENITQISDRFHLLKGLTDVAKKHITGLFKANIGLPVSASHYNSVKTSCYWAKETGKTDFPTRLHDSVVERKMKLVEETKQLNEEGYTHKKIAERIGVNVQTVKEYLKPDFSAEYSSYNTTYHSKIKPYADEIIKMVSKGNKFKEIEAVIRRKGFDGAASTIRMFTTRERKLLKEARATGTHNIERIERKWLISLLYKPIDKVKELSQEQLDKVIDENSVLGKIFDIVKSFKETLFSKKEAELDKWIEDALLLGIDELNSFIGGIKRDMGAVKNAIKYDYNNGLAEGSVNKLKVVKRIMYGRCSFNLLRNKLLMLEFNRKIN